MFGSHGIFGNNNMLGDHSLFGHHGLISQDLFRDPFFQDPFFHADPFQAGFLHDSARPSLAPYSANRLPQSRGRQVPVESPRGLPARSCSFRIEEVQDNEPANTTAHTPRIEEPEEVAGSTQQPARCQATCQVPPQAVATAQHPFSDPLIAFMLGSHTLGAPNAASVFCHTSTTYTQQAPDGTQLTQSSSSSYGPAGVAEHRNAFKNGRTGEQEMTISRQLQDKGCTVTQRKDAQGRQTQQQQLHNLGENGGQRFDQDWTYQAQQSLPEYMRSHASALPQAHRGPSPSALGW